LSHIVSVTYDSDCIYSGMLHSSTPVSHLCLFTRICVVTFVIR